MQGLHGTYLGLREIPRELSEFELQAFFTFSSTERAWIQRRRGPALKLGLALHIGFVRMSGRPLDAFRVLPVALLRHLGRELDIPAETCQFAVDHFDAVTAESGAARNHLDFGVRSGVTDALVKLWAFARTNFGPHIPARGWFGQS